MWRPWSVCQSLKCMPQNISERGELKAEHPKPLLIMDPSEIKMNNNKKWLKRKGMAFSRHCICSFIFRAPKRHTSFSNVDLFTNETTFFFNFTFTSVLAPCHESKRMYTRARCAADIIRLASLTQDNMGANTRKMLCEPCSYAITHQVVPETSPAFQKPGEKPEMLLSEASSTAFPYWNSGSQEHVTDNTILPVNVLDYAPFVTVAVWSRCMWNTMKPHPQKARK